MNRELLLSSEIHQLLEGPWPDDDAAKRCFHLRAELEHFVAGKEISICLQPYKAKGAFMGLTDPVSDGVWDIRSQKPKPSLRLLGMFAQRDTFLALLPAARSVPCSYIARGPLGDGGSEEWKAILRETKAMWRRIMQPWQPITGGDPSAYFSSKYHCI